MIWWFEVVDMIIIINIDVMLVKWKMSVMEFLEKVGIMMVNFFILKNVKVKVVCFLILEVICKVLEC